MPFKYKIYDSLGLTSSNKKEFKQDISRRIKLINKYIKEDGIADKEVLIQLKLDLMNLIY